MSWNTDKSANEIEQLKTALAEADSVVVGAGAGLSTSAGFTYSGSRFEKYFRDFAAKYGFNDMYSGGFYPYNSLEQFWGFWCRNIYINRYQKTPKPTYEKLLKLLEGKDYFVITTNVDHCFQKAGIDRNRLFYTQGDYGLWQHQSGRIKRTYDNEEQVKKMLLSEGFSFEHANTDDYKADWGELMLPLDANGKPDYSKLNVTVPKELIPLCPEDGTPLTMNLRSDDTFVEDAGWHAASDRYYSFLQMHNNGKVLFLDLGSGGNTPIIFKIPFMSWTRDWPSAIYATINKGQAFTAPEIKEKSIVIDCDIDAALDELLK